MMAFELLEPGSLKEAIALIDPDDPEVRPIAGGTALMLMMKAGVFRPRRLVSLRKLGDAFSRIAAMSGYGTVASDAKRTIIAKMRGGSEFSRPSTSALGPCNRTVNRHRIPENGKRHR